MSENRTSTFLLLLTTGGVIYLLYKRRSLDEDEEYDDVGLPGSVKRSRQTTHHKARWRPRGGSGSDGSGSSWLGWLFGGRDDALLEDIDATFIVKGKYFGPSPRGSGGPSNSTLTSARNLPHSKTVSLNEALNTTYDPSFLAPCPNCMRGTCRIKRHRDMNMSSSSTTSASSLANSPMHSGPAYLLPPTSTPESADDELSENESEVGRGARSGMSHHRAEKFHSR